MGAIMGPRIWNTKARRTQLANGSIILALLFITYVSIPWTPSTNQQHKLPVKMDCAPSNQSAIPQPIPSSSPNSILDPTKVAFLVETRPLKHLPALYAHMTAIIPPEWSFKLMGSPALVDFMRASPLIPRLEKSGKLEFLPIPSNYSLKNRETISQMFTDIHLYRDILAPAENLLVFQPDSIFCANAPTTLNDFVEWDWIGAPWSKTAEYGGNGGLSLRKVSKIIEVLKKNQRKIGDGALEDLWLASKLHALPNFHMPNANISKTFSVESVWDDKPLGYHIGWLGVHHEQIWDDPKQVDHVIEHYCPEVKIILGMKLDNDKPKDIS